MANNNHEGFLDERMKAVRLALLQESDADDFETCVRDVQASTGLSEKEARIVAGALREELLPKVAESLGLNEGDMADFHGKMHGMMGHSDNEDTTDFADDHKEFKGDKHFDHDLDTDTTAVEGNALDMGGDDAINDDMSDEDDLGSEQTLEIQVPAGKVNDVQEAIRAILGDDAFELGGDSDLDMDNDMVNDDDVNNSDFDDKYGDDAPETGKQVMSMSDKQLAERQARRKALLADTNGRGVRTANEQVKPKDRGLGSDTSHGGKPFQYAADAQMQGEDRRPGMTLDDSAGNSLKEQNPTFNETMVAAKNPEHLQLKNSYKTFKFEGPEGDIEYDMSADAFEVPSSGEKAGGDFEVPTQMDSTTLDRKTTVAKLMKNVERVAEAEATDDSDFVTANNDELFRTSDNRAVPRAEFEEHVIDTLVNAGVSENEVLAMSFAEGLELYGQVLSERQAAKQPATMEDITRAHSERQARIQKLASELKIEISGNASEEPDGTDETIEEKLKDSREAMREQFIREAELFKKRVKAAYGITTRLVVAGLIHDEEVDSHVDTWLKDNLSVGSMMKQGNFMLRAAQASNKRTVQAASGENTRTAGISVNPALVSPNLGNTQEVKDRLASIFSVGGISRVAFDDYEADKSRERREF